MSLLGSVAQLAKTAVDTAKLPVSLAADTLTGGGTLLDEDESFTAKNLRLLRGDVQKLQREFYE